ncbi:hypothetical protein H1R20_g11740, partial [Candolleomyces eurysporus]
MSSPTRHSSILPTSPWSVCDPDEFDDMARLHHPVHPIFRQPPRTPTAVCTSQDMLLRPSTSPCPSSSPPPLRLRSLHATIALPDVLPNLEGDLSVHRILQGSPSPLLLRWDVRMDPNAAKYKLDGCSAPQQPDEQRPRQWHDQPASTPSLDRIFIYTDAFPGQLIVARPNDDYDCSVVTIYDVLVAVHRAVQHARVGDGGRPEKETDILGAQRVESGDFERQRKGAEPDRRVTWSRWKWGGLVPATKGEEGWKLILK